MKRLFVYILFILSISFPVSGVYAVDFFTTQYGGYLGYVNAGIGWRYFNSWDSSFILGYVPENVGGKEIWSLSWKNDWHPFYEKGSTLDPVYLGAGIIFALNENLWTDSLLDNPTDGYDNPDQTHLFFHAGVSVNLGNHAFFYEITALDKVLEVYYNNYPYLQYNTVSSATLGYKYNFN